MGTDLELDSFKTGIDLRAFAAANGYELDRKESWQGSAVMRDAGGDKIVVKLDADGHYVYFSVRDDRDNGTIIDFVQRRHRLSLGAVRKELRPWTGGKSPIPVPAFAALPKTEKSRMKVEAAYARTKDASNGHPYLEQQRSIPAALLALDRFAGRIRVDDRGNAIFPHFDAQGLSGYEIKNSGFTGYSSGGTKALWLSQRLPDDNRLVFTEGAIDALSHAVLFPDDCTRYASIGGKPNPQQPELIRAAVARMPLSSEIVAAMDADADGRKLAEIVRKAVELSGRLDLKFTVQEPEGHKDWNDQLKTIPHPQLPLSRPPVPSVA